MATSLGGKVRKCDICGKTIKAQGLGGHLRSHTRRNETVPLSKLEDLEKDFERVPNASVTLNLSDVNSNNGKVSLERIELCDGFVRLSLIVKFP